MALDRLYCNVKWFSISDAIGIFLLNISDICENVERCGTTEVINHFNTVQHLWVAVDQRWTLTLYNFFATVIGFRFAEETKFFLPNQVIVEKQGRMTVGASAPIHHCVPL